MKLPLFLGIITPSTSMKKCSQRTIKTHTFFMPKSPSIPQDILDSIGQKTLAVKHPLKHNIALEVLKKLNREKGEEWIREHIKDVSTTIRSVTSIL